MLQGKPHRTHVAYVTHSAYVKADRTPTTMAAHLFSEHMSREYLYVHTACQGHQRRNRGSYSIRDLRLPDTSEASPTAYFN